MAQEQEDWVVAGIPKDPARPAAVWGCDGGMNATFHIWAAIPEIYERYVRNRSQSWRCVTPLWNEEPPAETIKHQTTYTWRRVSRSEFEAMVAMELARQMLDDSP